MNNAGTSYLLWLTWLFGLAGIHRFYNGKPVSGVLWLLTWGFFGLGQFVDLFLIPEMVEEHNYKYRARLGLASHNMFTSQPTIQVVVPQEAIAAATYPAQSVSPQTNPSTDKHQTTLKLLKAASVRGGKLSVTQAVLDTGLSFETVEENLKEMVKTGYVSIENHPDTGVVLYDFVEL